MIKVGIVGCGKIADAHTFAIRMIQNCDIVGVADKEELMAQQICERFNIASHYGNVSELIQYAKPDVVHITTPPPSHYLLAKTCLEHGCHVYVEKPFTLDYNEAVEIISLAKDERLKLTVGHDDQFSPVSRKLRKLVQNGYLGGSPIHMESYYNYELSGAYANALLGDKHHWIRKLPGQLLQNVISHGVSRIAEYFESETPNVIAYGFTSKYLKDLGEKEIIDELRVIVSENDFRTAYFTFSSQMRPSLRHFRIFGKSNGLMLDEDNQTLIRLRGKRFISYAERFIPPLIFAKQYIGNLADNLSLFLGREFHFKAGMIFLIGEFYRSITEDSSLPIPYHEILRTSNIMDEIFRQVKGGRQD